MKALRLSILVLTVGPSVGFTQTHNPITEFSASQNPSGNWSYGYAPTLGGSFIPFLTSQTVTSGVDKWSSPAVDVSMSIARNGTSAPIIGAPPTFFYPHDMLYMHPGQLGQYAVLRWRVPVTGRYSIFGKFQALDSVTAVASVDVHVWVNSVPVFAPTQQLHGFPQEHLFALTRELTVGDVIDFMVGPGSNGNHNNDSTGLQLAITASPCVSTPPTGTVQWTANGHYYGLTTTVSNWNVANVEAAVLGGHLVSIHSQREQDFIIGTYGTDQKWIGLSDHARTGVFGWTTGEPLTYTNWGGGNPDNIGTEHVVEINPQLAGGWNNVTDDHPRMGIVEFTPCGTPPHADTGAITVTSIPSGAGFQILGPGLTYYRDFTPFSTKNVLAGTYTVIWSTLLGDFSTPPPETKVLLDKQSIRFNGNYAPAGGVQPIRPIQMTFDPSGNRSDITQRFDNPGGRCGPHNGIDYKSPLFNEILSVGPDGVIHRNTKADAAGFGALNKDQKGPAVWVKYTLVSGDPIYVLFGHTAHSWEDKTTVGADFKFDCTYTLNWKENDTVRANDAVGLTAPFYNTGISQPHLHLGVFKPNKTCNNSFCKPPSNCWGYGPLTTKDGEFINPEDFFTDPAYKLKP